MKLNDITREFPEECRDELDALLLKAYIYGSILIVEHGKGGPIAISVDQQGLIRCEIISGMDASRTPDLPEMILEEYRQKKWQIRAFAICEEDAITSLSNEEVTIDETYLAIYLEHCIGVACSIEIPFTENLDHEIRQRFCFSEDVRLDICEPRLYPK